LGQRDVATGDAFGEALEALHALGDVGRDPFRAVDVVEDDFGSDLHTVWNVRVRAEFRNVSCMCRIGCPPKERNVWNVTQNSRNATNRSNRSKNHSKSRASSSKTRKSGSNRSSAR